MRLMISFLALFASVLLVQLGSGSLGPLDALSGAQAGFSPREIGFLGSAHFLGFFIGCWATPIMMGRIGHGRAFAAAASIGAIAALMHPVIVSPLAWSLCRIGTGFAVAGAYTVIESWLQAKVENANRGRVLSAYRFVDLIGSLGAQLLIAVLPAGHYISYNIVAMFCCLCMLPLTLSTSRPPTSHGAPRLRPIKTILTSPLGAAGIVTVGLTNSGFRMVGPIYGSENGLAPTQIAFFLAAAVLGGALAQPVVGWLADKYDRRWVLILLSVAALAVCAGLAGGAGSGAITRIYASAFIFGFVAFPLYSVSAAHANDHAAPDFVVEMNASLLFLYGVGAILSPYLAAELIQQYGPGALFLYIGAAHLALILLAFTA